ncbi:nuclear transport factor 2 family protein [Xanthomonas hyacinthi]|uniref:SnoaL-like domain-containing protein n=1 Tax=Xanthomonas hyacinthi TaxID=56455 RepID=A0A2S7EQQ2_9XANT|nr:nuclear transport factor 2 family protein [Xanthomonas hyacinthi]PPU95420.1 hypothetical protein XhyaCFBP1156_18830 [Xanthomonas hyacinthi]QGY78797.1 nuclear transport factor 2 family protein [Xanthomonas hyacinthi]
MNQQTVRVRARRWRMLRACSAALGLVALLSAAPLAYADSDAATAHAWQVVQRYLAAWNAHDVAAANRVLAPSVTYFNTSVGMESQGPDVIAGLQDRLLRLMPDLRWQIVGEPVITDDGVAFEWEVTGNARLLAETAHPSLTRPVRLRGASFARVEHGRIVYLADYYNGLSMQKQLAP